MLRFLFFILVFVNTSLQGQDVFFLQSQQIPGFLNPGLTGLNGSLSLKLVAKNQLFGRQDFMSGGIAVEQSFPCYKLDGGVFHISDKEGAGSIVTHHTGANVVYTAPFKVGVVSHNIRLGSKFQFTHKSIDWEALTFSDQINPKYNLTNSLGIPNPTSFVAPDWNSYNQLTLGIGVVHRADFGKYYKWSLTWGVAADNYTSIFEKDSYESLLKLKNERDILVNKWSFYLKPEFPIVQSYKRYASFSPSVIFLKESSLSHYQIGFDLNYQRAYGVNLHYTSGQFRDIDFNTHAIIMGAYFKIPRGAFQQINFAIQYMHHIGGVSEVFGQSFQCTISYIFKRDGCASTPTTNTDCPQTSKSNAVHYDNIWIN